MIKERMKVRVKIGSSLAYGDLRAGTIPPNSSLMIDFVVHSIDNFPHDEDKELEHLYCEIVNCSSEGDR